MKKMLAMMLAMALKMAAGAAMAEEFAAEKSNALAAFQVSIPDAAVDYVVREREDGQYEWRIFFTQGDQIGMCRVKEESNEIHEVELFKKEAGMMNAGEAMAKLAEKKGAVTVIELELDRDDGQLFYEGDVQLDGKRYEFEMKANGEIIEWERD